jgi:hypothetical protein
VPLPTLGPGCETDLDPARDEAPVMGQFHRGLAMTCHDVMPSIEEGRRGAAPEGDRAFLPVGRALAGRERWGMSRPGRCASRLSLEDGDQRG